MKIGTLVQSRVLCEVLHLLLKAAGHTPINMQEETHKHLPFSGSLQLASVHIERGDLDLLLIDTDLPFHCSEIEALKCLSTQTHGLPLVLLTLDELPQSQKEELERVEILVKPFRAEELQAVVRRAIAAYAS